MSTSQLPFHYAIINTHKNPVLSTSQSHDFPQSRTEMINSSMYMCDS